MNRGQSRRASLVEAVANMAAGLGFGFLANILVLPLFGLPVGMGQAAGITATFAALSVARSFALRRIFNWIDRRAADGWRR